MGSLVGWYANPTTMGDAGGPEFNAPVVLRLEGLPVVAGYPMRQGVNFATELTRVVASFADNVVGGHSAQQKGTNHIPFQRGTLLGMDS